MAATKAAARAKPIVRNVNPLQPFVWEGLDKRGTRMKGETMAKNANMLKAELRKQGINPGMVKPKPKPMFGAAGKTISAKEISIFSRQLATMMQSGVPLVTSFEIIAGGQQNIRMKNMLDDVRGSLEGGSTLAESLARHPLQFDDLFVNLVRAGEGAGVLETVLHTIATYKENTETLKGKIKKALFYPAVVIAVAVLVSAVLLIFVVPQFQNVFKSFGADLPAFTLMIIGASDFMQSWWWAIRLLAAAAFTGLIELNKR